LANTAISVEGLVVDLEESKDYCVETDPVNYKPVIFPPIRSWGT